MAEEYDIALAKQTYMTCAACHGQNGEGGQLGPPLANNQWVTGPAENFIRIQLRGIQGPVHPQPGEVWTGAAPMMAPNAYLTDDQLAAVISHVRNSWGNKASIVTADDVKALRDEVGKPMLTEADLEPIPIADAIEEVNPDAPKADPPNPPNESGLPVLGWVGVIGWFALCGIGVLAGLGNRK